MTSESTLKRYFAGMGIFNGLIPVDRVCKRIPASKFLPLKTVHCNETETSASRPAHSVHSRHGLTLNTTIVGIVTVFELKFM